MARVEHYTDDQLQKALRSYGLNIPITPNSRKVCETKLKKFMSQNDEPDFAKPVHRKGEYNPVVNDVITPEKYHDPAPRTSIWKYIGLAVFVIVLISFLVSLNRNAHNIDDEI